VTFCDIGKVNPKAARKLKEHKGGAVLQGKLIVEAGMLCLAEAGFSWIVVEVTRTTAAKDRRLARLYGGGNIPVYWIVNVADRQLEVYSNPAGGAYSAPTILGEAESVDLVIAGAVVGRIAVADRLPPDGREPRSEHGFADFGLESLTYEREARRRRASLIRPAAPARTIRGSVEGSGTADNWPIFKWGSPEMS
jgi:hypothetical protein